MKRLPLTRGLFALVDDDVYEWASGYKWYAQTTAKPYAIHVFQDRKKRLRVFLHKLIVNAPDGVEVDHIDHNILNCLRSNLRIVTPGQNRQNRNGATRKSKTQIRGVDWRPEQRLFRARVKVGGHEVFCKYFKTSAEAEMAVKRARRALMTHSEECLNAQP
jgi:hypothetical protein